MSPTGYPGLKSGNSVVPYSQTTKRTKVVNLDTVQDGSTGGLIPSSGSFTSVQFASGYAYSDSNNVWYLKGEISATLDSNFTNLGISIEGVTFSTIYSQSANPTRYSDEVCYIDYTSNAIQLNRSTSNANLRLEFNCRLESEPTWAAANMEASSISISYDFL